MFSLRQITCAGFMGVFSGCFLLSHNFSRLPYFRGAVIGIAFGTLMQVVVMLLYLLLFVLACQICGDVMFIAWETRILFILMIVGLQGLSAVGCRMMGKYFLYPELDMTSFDRRPVEEKMKALDVGKTSVVNDMTRIFEKTPFVPAGRISWFHVAIPSILSMSATVAWIYQVRAAFDPLWFEGATMDAVWAFNLIFNMTLPFILLLGSGYTYLMYLSKKKFAL